MADQLPMRYFSIAEGASVPRYGTGTFIAARRTPKGMVFDTERVVAIPAREVARYAKEYGRALGDGSLVERSAKDFDAAEKKRADAEKKAVGDREAMAKKDADAAAAAEAKQAEAERELVAKNQAMRQARREKALKAAKAEASKTVQAPAPPLTERDAGKAGG